MIDYLQVYFRVRHSDDLTTFMRHSSFLRIFVLIAIPIRCTYILTNIVEVAEAGAEDPELHGEFSNLVFRL